jgi:hypothetical protein
MPSKSQSQFIAMEIAKNNPSKLNKKNKGLAKMSKSQLDDFTQGSPKNLPKKVGKK